MNINKMGYEHLIEKKNCQDYFLNTSDFKCVVDGCSGSKHSEVGSKLFIKNLIKNKNIENTFENLVNLFDYNEIIDYLLFTIITLKETDTEFIVEMYGDGFIITQSIDDTIDFIEIDENNTPSYLAYNYLLKEHLLNYQEGINKKIFTFSKTEYKKIGISTDGLKYLLESSYKELFIEDLLNNNEIKLNRTINKFHNKNLLSYLGVNTISYLPELLGNIKDDITIIF